MEWSFLWWLKMLIVHTVQVHNMHAISAAKQTFQSDFSTRIFSNRSVKGLQSLNIVAVQFHKVGVSHEAEGTKQCVEYQS